MKSRYQKPYCICHLLLALCLLSAGACKQAAPLPVQEGATTDHKEGPQGALSDFPQGHFGRAVKAIDRDIGGHLGTDIDIVPKLLRDGLREDYQGQFAELKVALSSQDVELLEAALEAMAGLGKKAHFLAPAVCSLLFKAHKHKDRQVREVAENMLYELVQAAPSKAVRSVLLTACKDPDPQMRHVVRNAALIALGELVRVVPHHTDAVLAPVLAACKDRLPLIRIAGLQTLGVMVQVAPPVRHGTVLLHAARDENVTTRSVAIGFLGVLAKAVPRLAPVVYDVLIRAIQDEERAVRQAALKALATLLQVFPHYQATARAVLHKATQDPCMTVRQKALHVWEKFFAI